MTQPTMTVQEALDLFRKYDVPMSQKKLQESLKRGIYTFGDAIELDHWSFTIWRLPFLEWLREKGVCTDELDAYKNELRSRGWEERKKS